MDPGLSFALGFLLSFSIALCLALWRLPFVRKEAMEEVIERATKEASAAAKEEVYLHRKTLETELAGKQEQLDEREERCRLREDALDQRVERLESREHELLEREASFKSNQASLEVRAAEVEQAHERELRELERISAMRREEAEHLLLERVEQSCQGEAEQVRARAEVTLQEEVKGRARELLLTAMRRQTGRAAREALVTTVQLVDDELKLALVGREGRNVRVFQAATGVDLLIDDTPGAVVLSAFEPVRREVARRALLALLEDGRIHPERIQQAVDDARQGMTEAVRELGAAAAEAAGVSGLHPRLLVLVGRLEFHTWKGQNARERSIQTAQLAGSLAAELGLEPALARRCGLLHMIGHAIERDHEGSAAEVGADFARRCDEDARVIEAIATFRRRPEALSTYGALIEVAERAVRKRPGASDERVEVAISRREELERIAERHAGVKRAYAVQAGRVLRVLVDPTTVSERAATRLARDVAREIEQGAPSAGQVEVLVLRESRATESAT